MNSKWNILAETLVTLPNEIIPKKVRQKKSKWKNKEIIDLMNK